MNTIYCDFYEICGTATYVPNKDLEYYNDGYQCAECFDAMDLFVSIGQYNDRYETKTF